jgi:hypothetical protein
VRGYTFSRLWVIICEQCNENIVERADESEIRTRADAEEYARGHQALHDRDAAGRQAL